MCIKFNRGHNAIIHQQTQKDVFKRLALMKSQEICVQILHVQISSFAIDLVSLAPDIKFDELLFLLRNYQWILLLQYEIRQNITYIM